jgi:RNA polymerase sigma-70 factor (ECF subfamily)
VVLSFAAMSDPRTEPSAAQPPDEPSGSVPDGTEAASDEMLLLGARLRDESALAMLYDRYGGLVFTLALRVLGDRDLAEEVMQDVFLRCWHGLEQYDAARGTLPGWLLGIARNRSIDLLRGRQHQARLREREPLPEPGELEPGTPDRAEEVVLRAMVGQALTELSEPQREAIELAYYGGLTQAEVADQLGEPLGTIRTRIRDGLRRLRRMLAPIVDVSAAREGGAS